MDVHKREKERISQIIDRQIAIFTEIWANMKTEDLKQILASLDGHGSPKDPGPGK